MMKSPRYIFFVGLLILMNNALAQQTAINNFIVKEDLFKNDKLVVIAANDDDEPVENLNGTFLFSINGFKEELRFNNSSATVDRQIDKSTFVYLKHSNGEKTHVKLYYVLKRDKGLTPLKISWLILLIIPALLIILGMMFRKFIIIALVLLAVIFFFNYSNGLDISTFFETIYRGFTSLF